MCSRTSPTLADSALFDKKYFVDFGKLFACRFPGRERLMCLEYILSHWVLSEVDPDRQCESANYRLFA
jgi:hypothetical protein